MFLLFSHWFPTFFTQTDQATDDLNIFLKSRTPFNCHAIRKPPGRKSKSQRTPRSAGSTLNLEPPNLHRTSVFWGELLMNLLGSGIHFQVLGFQLIQLRNPINWFNQIQVTQVSKFGDQQLSREMRQGNLPGKPSRKILQENTPLLNACLRKMLFLTSRQHFLIVLTCS